MKKRLLILSLLLLPTIAYSQEVTLKLQLPETELVWKGLRKLPVEEVEILMTKMRQQVMEQTQPKPAGPMPTGNGGSGGPNVEPPISGAGGKAK